MNTDQTCECGHGVIVHVYARDPIGREVAWCGGVVMVGERQFAPCSCGDYQEVKGRAVLSEPDSAPILK